MVSTVNKSGSKGQALDPLMPRPMKSLIKFSPYRQEAVLRGWGVAQSCCLASTKP